MGQDAEEILHSTNIMEEERGKHDDVRKSFNQCSEKCHFQEGSFQ
jgi:hypothetical protein